MNATKERYMLSSILCPVTLYGFKKTDKFTAHKILPSHIHENYNKFTKNHDTLVNKIKIQKHALL